MLNAREICKGGWLQFRSRGGKGVKKKAVCLDEQWIVLCVHDDRIPFLEVYVDRKAAQKHEPLKLYDLINCSFVSVSVEDVRSFVIGLSDMNLELVAANEREKLDWINMLTFKLRRLGFLEADKNIYSALPIAQTRGSVSENQDEGAEGETSSVHVENNEFELPDVMMTSSMIPQFEFYEHISTFRRLSTSDEEDARALESAASNEVHIPPILPHRQSLERVLDMDGNILQAQVRTKSCAAPASQPEILRDTTATLLYDVPPHLQHSSQAQTSNKSLNPEGLVYDCLGPGQRVVQSETIASSETSDTVNATQSLPGCTYANGATSDDTDYSVDARYDGPLNPPRPVDWELLEAERRRKKVLGVSAAANSENDAPISYDAPQPPLSPPPPTPVVSSRPVELARRPLPIPPGPRPIIHTPPSPVHRTDATVPNATSQPKINKATVNLKEKEVLDLQREMELGTTGLKVRVPLQHAWNLVLVDVKGCIWIAGWHKDSHNVLRTVFHIGDEVLSVNERHPKNAKEADGIIRQVPQQPRAVIEILIRRLPLARVLLLRRDQDGQDLGLVRENGKNVIVAVEPGSIVQRAGLQSSTASYLTPETPVHWCLTEVNNRALNLFAKNNEAAARLGAVGKEISILVQPEDFVKALKKQLKAKRRHYKDYACT